MALDTQTFTGTLVVEHCITCKCTFGINNAAYRRYKDKKETFYCPNGHPMVYSSTTDQDLRTELANVKANLARERDWSQKLTAEAEHQRRKVAAQKGQLTKLKNRTARGLCPCCDQYFPSLHKHMEEMHPDFEATEELG